LPIIIIILKFNRLILRFGSCAINLQNIFSMQILTDNDKYHIVFTYLTHLVQPTREEKKELNK